MTQVNSDTVGDDYDLDCFSNWKSDTTIRLSDREDEETVTKTKSLPMPKTFPLSNKSLLGRVTEGPIEEIQTSNDPLPIDADIVEQLKEIDPEHFQAVEKAILENAQPDTNYMIKIRNLIAQILVQLNKIAEKDRTQIDEMKTKYKNSTLEAANLQRDLGWNGLKFSGVALAASFLQFLSPHQSDREIVNIFAKECCPKLGDMFGSSIQANMHQSNSLANLVLQEYTAKTQKGQSDSSNKQELIGILDKVLQSVKEAARAG